MAERTPKVKRKHGVLYYPVVFILVCLALALGLSVFFRVGNIQVSGNRVYTAEEVAEASGIQDGDNLFFINRISVAARIRSQLSYVDSVSLRRSFPNRIEIIISESKGIAYLTAESTYWVIDSSGKILSEVEPSEVTGLIHVKGITPVEPEEGADLAVESTQSAALNYLLDLLQGLEDNDMEDTVTYIDMSNVSSPSFDYLDRFTVNFGTDTDIDYKFLLLLSAIDEMEPGDSGTLDLSEDGKVHLKYS